MLKEKIFLILLVALGILLSCNSAYKSQSDDGSSTTQKTDTVNKESEIIGRSAPSFSLKNLDGEEISLKDFEDEIILLNFWATWCPACKEEIPGLIDIHTKQNNVKVIGISLDRRKTTKELKKFASDNEINYPVLEGEQAKIEKIVAEYGGIKGIPTTFLIDKEGKIRHKWVGAKKREQFMSEAAKYQ